MKNCPECGALAVLFANGNHNDLTAVGLRCANRCGWKLTMENQQAAIKELTLLCEEVIEAWIILSEGAIQMKDLIGDRLREALQTIRLNRAILWRLATP